MEFSYCIATKLLNFIDIALPFSFLTCAFSFRSSQIALVAEQKTTEPKFVSRAPSFPSMVPVKFPKYAITRIPHICGLFVTLNKESNANDLSKYLPKATITKSSSK